MNKELTTPVSSREEAIKVLSILQLLGFALYNAETPEQFLKRHFGSSAPALVGFGGTPDQYVTAWYSSVSKDIKDRALPLPEFLAEVFKLPKKTTVKLNSEYSAEITKDEVTVGCQKIPADKVLEVAEKIKELRK